MPHGSEPGGDEDLVERRCRVRSRENLEFRGLAIECPMPRLEPVGLITTADQEGRTDDAEEAEIIPHGGGTPRDVLA